MVLGEMQKRGRHGKSFLRCPQLKRSGVFARQRKVHSGYKQEMMYNKCVINAWRGKVGQVKIAVEIWMSPSKSR